MFKKGLAIDSELKALNQFVTDFIRKCSARINWHLVDEWHFDEQQDDTCHEPVHQEAFKEVEAMPVKRMPTKKEMKQDFKVKI